MNLGVLFTGGKDSTYASFLASKQNTIKCLINADSENKDSYMFHTVGAKLLEKQAETMRLPLERFFTEGEKEKELRDLEDFLIAMKKKYKLEGIVSGAIASEYQLNRIKTILDRTGLKSLTPLWHTNVHVYLEDFIREGFRAIIISVSADGLDTSWLGKEINEENLLKLKILSEKYKFHLGFEGGEAETAVLDGPIFDKRISVLKSRVIDEGNKHYLDIEDAVLVDKN
jgi:ABC transporter with metal-binding/Fe-S-binding domain ATP-binding protein